MEVRLVPLGSAWPAEVSRLRHRLLAGEVLYIPARFGRVLSAQHAVPLVLELTLG
ncbi:hypothetical protein OG539_38420 [Actinacidiphila glaucinigra]|uniref:hypothetical protein n=1 Tax=Actinacidiphila glaucinigra TaxID=235986 RepID=UPI003252A190